VITSDDRPLVASIASALELAGRLDYESWDPYDMLLAPAGPLVQRLSHFGARVVVQVGKRSGRRVRRILRVPPHVEPKAVAELLRAAVVAAPRAPELEPVAGRLARLLIGLSRPTRNGCGWGLAFPYASRFVNAADATPNLYVTIVACEALLDFASARADDEARTAAAAGCSFIVDDLGRFELGGRRWIRYWYDNDAAAVNVQASAAALLQRASDDFGEARYQAMAEDAAELVLAVQSPDGSWPYAGDGRATFVDSFHTGFTLQGLAEYAARRPDESVTRAVDAGFRFFKTALLDQNGLPLGRVGGGVSLEGQTVAQAIQTLVVCGGREDVAAAKRLWHRHLEPLLATKRPHGEPFVALRWTVGPAALATAYLLLHDAG
jgi:hypothetical protein